MPRLWQRASADAPVLRVTGGNGQVAALMDVVHEATVRADLDDAALIELRTRPRCYAAQVIVEALIDHAIGGDRQRRAAVSTLQHLRYRYEGGDSWSPPDRKNP